MKIFIKRHNNNAGRWIYQGYESAWKSIGYKTFYYDSLDELHNEENFYLMGVDSDISNTDHLKILNKANKVFLFVLPTYFPSHWGKHPNWITGCKVDINEINNFANIIKWTFLDQCSYFDKWNKVITVPLAFDDINYQHQHDQNYKFDVCYVGGWANNGFDEKKKNMINHFSKLKSSNLNCGLFINKNISHDIETKILSNSLISLNIHDDYQKELGLDTNERTFKSLGLNGIMISDRIKQIDNLVLNVKMSNDVQEYFDLIIETLKEPYLDDIRQNNKINILGNHTYKNRIKELLNV